MLIAPAYAATNDHVTEDAAGVLVVGSVEETVRLSWCRIVDCWIREEREWVTWLCGQEA